MFCSSWTSACRDHLQRAGEEVPMAGETSGVILVSFSVTAEHWGQRQQPQQPQGSLDNVIKEQQRGEELTFEEVTSRVQLCFYKLKQVTEKKNLRTGPDIHLQKVPLWRCLVFIDSWGKYLALVVECSTVLSSKLQALSRTRWCCTGSIKGMCESWFAITAVGRVCKQKC